MPRLPLFSIAPLVVLLLVTGAASGFEVTAYVPAYRIEPSPGAENALGRPSFDPAPLPWAGRTVSDRRDRSVLPEHWSEANWALRLTEGYDVFLLHLPLEEAFLAGEAPDPRHLAFLRTLRSAGGGRIGISLLGHSEDFMPVAGGERLEAFAIALAELCAEQDLDVVDLDWEFASRPREREIEALNALAAGLRRSLPEDVALTAALSRWRLPGPEFFESAETIHLMAYDGYGKHATYAAAVADAETVLSRSDLEPGRLVLGIPFYGRIHDAQSPDYWKEAKNYRLIVGEFDPPPDADEAGGYYFNGPRTVAAKTAWARKRGLAGVFVWEPFYDAPGDRSLAAVIAASAAGQ